MLLVPFYVRWLRKAQEDVTLRHSLKAREQVQRPWGGRVCYVRVVTGGEVRRQREQGQE